MTKNTNEEIEKILILLNCLHLVERGKLERYRYADIRDKEVQYSMLDHNAEAIFKKDMRETKIIFKEVKNDFRYEKLYKGKVAKDFIEIWSKTLFECEKLLTKYENIKVDQNNIQNFIDDSYEVDKVLKEYLSFKSRFNIMHQYIIS